MAEALCHSGFGETVAMEIGELAALGDNQTFQVAEIIAAAATGKESLISLYHREVPLELFVKREHFLLSIGLLLLICHITDIMEVLPFDIKALLDHLSLLDEILHEENVALLRKILLFEPTLRLRR